MRDDRIREEIRSRVDIVDIVSSHLTLKRAGQSYKGLCPFHEEKTPSFNVIPSKQLYYCFGCHASGDVFKFVMEMEKLTFPEAMKRLADRAGIRYEPRASSPAEVTERERQHLLHREAARFFHENLLKSPAAQHARNYLAQRGVSAEAIAKFQLGYALDSWEAAGTFLQRRAFKLTEIVRSGLVIERESGTGAYDRFRNRLMFPIHDAQGKVIAFGGRTLGADDAKYINSPENLLFTKGQTLYGLHFATSKIRERDAAVICEGYMDLIALHEHGFDHAVAPMGTALTPWSLGTLRRFTKNLFACFDGDSAGMNAVLRIAHLFEHQEVTLRVVTLPSEDDPDTFLRKHGREALEQKMREALPLIDYRIDRAAARHNVTDDASRKALVKDVMPILLGIRDYTTLEAQIVKVAERWAGGDLNRAQSIEAALKMELRQQARALAHSAAPPSENATESSSPAPPQSVAGYVRAERQLLAAALHDLEVARSLFTELAPQEFSESTNVEIAGKLHVLAMATGEHELSSPEARKFVEELSVAGAALAGELFAEPAQLDERRRAKIVREIKNRRAKQDLSAQLKQAAPEIDEGKYSADLGRAIKSAAEPKRMARFQKTDNDKSN